MKKKVEIAPSFKCALKKYLKENDMPGWKMAAEVGLHSSVFSRILCGRLSGKKIKLVLMAIAIKINYKGEIFLPQEQIEKKSFPMPVGGDFEKVCS